MYIYHVALLLLGIYPREIKTCSHNDFYVNVRDNVIRKSHKLETALISINW